MKTILRLRRAPYIGRMVLSTPYDQAGRRARRGQGEGDRPPLGPDGRAGGVPLSRARAGVEVRAGDSCSIRCAEPSMAARLAVLPSSLPASRLPSGRDHREEAGGPGHGGAAVPG